MISRRIKAALQAKRAQGDILGKPENLTAEAQAKGVAGNVRRAAENENNRRPMSMAQLMHTNGTHYNHIANALNQAKFRTAMGCQFKATQVSRLLKRTNL